MQESRNYAPFGEVWGTTGTNQTNYGFTGEPTDSNGLVYLRARYLNPAFASFLSQDKVETLNRFFYADANPINRTDPTGMIAMITEDEGRAVMPGPRPRPAPTPVIQPTPPPAPTQSIQPPPAPAPVSANQPTPVNTAPRPGRAAIWEDGFQSPPLPTNRPTPVNTAPRPGRAAIWEDGLQSPQASPSISQWGYSPNTSRKNWLIDPGVAQSVVLCIPITFTYIYYDSFSQTSTIQVYALCIPISDTLAFVYNLASLVDTILQFTSGITQTQPLPKPRKYQNQTCDEDIRLGLEERKDIACKGPFSCSDQAEKLGRKKESLLSCDELVMNIFSTTECMLARQKIQDECFRNSLEPGHKQQMNDLRRGLEVCKDKARSRCS